MALSVAGSPGFWAPGAGQRFWNELRPLFSLLGFKAHYFTSGKLLEDLTAALADRTIHDRVRFYAKFSMLIIDAFYLLRTQFSQHPSLQKSLANP